MTTYKFSVRKSTFLVFEDLELKMPIIDRSPDGAFTFEEISCKEIRERVFVAQNKLSWSQRVFFRKHAARAAPYPPRHGMYYHGFTYIGKRKQSWEEGKYETKITYKMLIGARYSRKFLKGLGLSDADRWCCRIVYECKDTKQYGYWWPIIMETASNAVALMKAGRKEVITYTASDMDDKADRWKAENMKKVKYDEEDEKDLIIEEEDTSPVMSTKRSRKRKRVL